LWKKLDNFRPVLSIGILMVISGGLAISIPYLKNLALLISATTLAGFSFGYLDSGAVSLFFKAWGPTGSRPIIQGYHFAVSFGSVLAPAIAAPFIEKAQTNTNTNEAESCPGSKSNESLYSAVASTSGNDVDPIVWPYVIAGSSMIVFSVVLVVFAPLNIDKKMMSSNISGVKNSGEYKEEQFKDVFWILLAVSVFYISFTSQQRVFDGYIYSMALCSSLSFTVTKSARLNSLYWLGMLIGRGLGILYAEKFQPKTMILYGLFGNIISMVAFVVFGELIPSIIWISTFFFALCISTTYSSGISWTSQVMNVSSSYLFIFSLGNGIGSMVIPPIAGLIFENEPFALSYLLVGFSGLNVMSFSVLYLIGRNHVAPKQSSDWKTKL